MSLLRALLRKNQFQDINGIDTSGFHSGAKNVTINKSHFYAFCESIGWPSHNQLPPTYLQVLANKYVQNILTQSGFPFRPLGIVHIENEINMLADVDLNLPIDIYCQLQPLQQHHKGVCFSVVIDVRQFQRNVYKADCKMLCIDNTLAKTKRSPHAEYQKAENAITKNLTFPSDIGRRYAKVSGDYNPIHLTSLTAKLLGFKRAIAHGMYSQALCLSQLHACESLKTGSTIKVKFKQPLFLSTASNLDYACQQDKKVEFTLVTNGKVNLQGQVTPAL
ncbi:MAG: hypothetical protein GJ680_02550 [Alteromonadaceae bacterium]|nr:hypothetical protein [Alteromonadaceae bacterium]